VWISLISTALFAGSRLAHPGTVMLISGWLFAILGACVAVCMIHPFFRIGEKHHA
jgi:hypothetical protein